MTDTDRIIIDKSTFRWLVGGGLAIILLMGKLLWSADNIINLMDKRIVIIETQHIQLQLEIKDMQDNVNFIRNNMVGPLK